MSANDEILNALTRHQIFVLRYARGREREAEDFVSTLLLSIISRLEDEPMTEFNRNRLQEQARDYYQYLLASNAEFAESFIGEMREFAGYEAGFNARTASKNLAVDFSRVSPLQLEQAIFGDILNLEPSRGYTIRGMLDQFGREGANLVVSQIRDSIALGETNDQLISKIRALVPMQQRKAATIARTVTNHVAVQARNATMKENDDVIEGYEWVATLDSRTSLICSARDGVIYRDFDKDPKPPAHFNCRSTITMVVNPEYDLGRDIKGTRPSKGSSGTKQVSANLTYDGWLRRQSKAFQDQVLGPSRASMFRDGMKLDRFIDGRGNTLTLAQLANADAYLSGREPEIPDILPEPELQEAAAVLASMFTTSKRDVQGGLNAIFAEVKTKEMAQLQEFIRLKGTKTLVLKQAQMGRNSKSARAIKDDVAEYLLSGDKDTAMYHELLTGLQSQQYSKNAYAPFFYTSKRATRTNGFTSSAWNHVVVKENTKATYKDPVGTAERIREAITKVARSNAGKSDQPWSFSHIIRNEFDDQSAQMASTMIHELGHQVHYFAGFPEWPAHLNNARMTQYGAFNTAESHAEMFVAWVFNRQELFRRSPEAARYMDEMFERAMASGFRTGKAF